MMTLMKSEMVEAGNWVRVSMIDWDGYRAYRQICYAIGRRQMPTNGLLGRDGLHVVPP